MFWIHASNAARFEQSFWTIANCVKVRGRKTPSANVFQLVCDWLRDERKGRWLIILDNVDDASFLFNARGAARKQSIHDGRDAPLVSYLPHCKQGSVLVTTRSRDAALTLVEPRDVITVGPMDEASALILLERKLNQRSPLNGGAKLAVALEFMPLAIVQAAAYIFNRAPRFSVERYLEEFIKSDRKKASLLSSEAGQLRRDFEAKNSIIVTWQLSFDHIRQVRPSAGALLSLMSFFDPQGIPESLLRRQDASYGNKLQTEVKTTEHQGDESDGDSSNADTEGSTDKDDTIEDDILVLRNYSFISVASKQSFKMHNLVQLATRKWLEIHNQQERWKRQFINNLAADFPREVSYEDWAVCQQLFPHVKSAAALKVKDRVLSTQLASLLHEAGWYALNKGNWPEAEEMYREALRARKKAFGMEHSETLSCMVNLATTYWSQGRWDAAEQLETQVRKIREKELGNDDLDTLTSVSNHASTLWSQGHVKQAEKLWVQVMDARRTKLGHDHPDTLTSMAYAALILWSLGRLEEAERLETHVMETRKASLGVDHPDTLISMSNLASTYRYQGRLQEAEHLDVQVVENRTLKLGPDHPSTLSSIGELASTYRNQGRLQEAEQLETQILETRKTKLGIHHPSTLANMANLASTLWNQGRWEEAEQLDVEVMELRKEKLGLEHPSTLSSMSNLASTYKKQDRWEEAEKLHLQVIEIRRSKMGADHPDTLGSMANLASTYKVQGRWEEAEMLETEVIELRETKLGANHPETLNSMNNLAITWKGLDRDAEAMQLMRECVERQNQVLGATHPHSLISQTTLNTWEAELSDASAEIFTEERDLTC